MSTPAKTNWRIEGEHSGACDGLKRPLPTRFQHG